jgi:hypothetical protein
MFDAVRSRDPDVSKLYADLEGEGFSLVLDRARGTVMRAYSADGLARGGGVVVEMAHERPDGAIAWFHVSAREGTGGADTGSDEVSADYTVRLGERVETCAIEGGRMRNGRDGRVVADKGRSSSLIRLRAGRDSRAWLRGSDRHGP